MTTRNVVLAIADVMNGEATSRREAVTKEVCYRKDAEAHLEIHFRSLYDECALREETVNGLSLPHRVLSSRGIAAARKRSVRNGRTIT